VGTRLILSNATVVTPGGLIEGSVVCEDGVIVAVEPRTLPGGLDLRGALLTPGLVDLHNDGLESEIHPRPGVGLPLDFALQNFDRRAAASGVVLAFHAITFANLERKGRHVGEADQRAKAIRAAFGETIVEHQVLFRADVWQPQGLTPLFQRARDWDVRLMTLDDHTPGQGQYRDIDGYIRFIQEWANTTAEEAEEQTRQKIAFARENPEVAAETFRRVAAAVGPLRLTLGSHDDHTPERCEFMYALGARVAEFPVTLEAAQKARELGMTIVAGAPNIVRGGSHSGNVSAAELVARGLCDVLVADYHAPSLLLAAQRLVEGFGLPVERAVAMVSTSAGRLAGRELTIAPGNEGTFTIVRCRAGRPWQAAAVVRHGEVRAQFEDFATKVEPALV
jgi:alpha-D-ribose 1-methylphosphonate 5-triphosphate diphosphatase